MSGSAQEKLGQMNCGYAFDLGLNHPDIAALVLEAGPKVYLHFEGMGQQTQEDWPWEERCDGLTPVRKPPPAE